MPALYVRNEKVVGREVDTIKAKTKQSRPTGEVSRLKVVIDFIYYYYLIHTSRSTKTSIFQIDKILTGFHSITEKENYQSTWYCLTSKSFFSEK